MRRIEPNIPIPKRSKLKWGWLLELGVNDSVALTPLEGVALRSSVTHLSKMNDRKFTIRRVDDGYRVWRVE